MVIIFHNNSSLRASLSCRVRLYTSALVLLLALLPSGSTTVLALPPSDSSSSSMFSSIVRQSTKALAATARGSTRVAADLVRPKEVDWNELVGWWRLDIARDDDDDNYNYNDNDSDDSGQRIITLQITRHGKARYTDAHGVLHESTVDFRPASWPRSAKLKFGGDKNGNNIIYECTIQRKLANLDILKLRGKIYVSRRFQGKVQVGTFVGRRRVVIAEEQQQENDEEDGEEEEEAEYSSDYEEEEEEGVQEDEYSSDGSFDEDETTRSENGNDETNYCSEDQE